jgi:hypothetical protein
VGNFYNIGQRPLRVAVPGYSELSIASVNTTYNIPQNGYVTVTLITSEEGFEKSIPFWFVYARPTFSVSSGGWSILFRLEELEGGTVVATYDIAGASMNLGATFTIQCNEVVVTPNQWQPSDKARFVSALAAAVIRSRYEGATLRRQRIVARIDNGTNAGGNFSYQHNLGVLKTRI